MFFQVFFGITAVVWLLILTVIVYRLRVHYDRLIGGSGKTTLREVLEKILLEKKDFSRKQDLILEDVGKIQHEIGYHISRIGIVRFNPFSDTGGSQSFTVALLDDRENGIVMTSLFARTGNRWYVKEIRKGTGNDLELTKEELQAIDRAKKQKR